MDHRDRGLTVCPKCGMLVEEEMAGECCAVSTQAGNVDRPTDEELQAITDRWDRTGEIDPDRVEGLLDEVFALRNDARTWYEADGTAEVLGSALDVVARRRKAARELVRLRGALAFVETGLGNLFGHWRDEAAIRRLTDVVKAAMKGDS